jgi:GH15 family glucan-1,4-alpha-glucosidase
VPTEKSLTRLSGYPGGADKAGHWRAAGTAVKAIESRWGEPDAGVWELGNQRWAHSRLMCVAGLRAIAAAGAAPAQAAAWETLADTILADVAADCVHASGRWQRAPGDDRVDAALLLAAIRGAVPAADPRSLATLGAIASGLCSDGYVYRYRHGQRPLQEAEGAFVLGAAGPPLECALNAGGPATAIAAGHVFTREGVTRPGWYRRCP